MTYKVYRKPTNKSYYIHYLSALETSRMRGVVIVFFLCTLRKCSECHLEQKIKDIILSWNRDIQMIWQNSEKRQRKYIAEKM